MKRVVYIVILVLLTESCSVFKKASQPEEGLVMTRKYAGTFIEYRQTAPERFGDPSLIWIKTNMEGTFGRMSAYSKDCKFAAGDRLYISRVYLMPGMSGFWEYYIESDDASKRYKLTEFQNDKKVTVESWFVSSGQENE